MQLRTYQQKAKQLIKEALSRKVERIILQLETGGGKTVIFSDIILNAYKKGTSCIVFLHRISLYNQTIETLKRYNVECFGINAETKKIEKSNVYVAMAQTITARINDKNYADAISECDMIIIDECHRQEFNQIFIKGLVKKYVIGFSATPAREGKQKQLHLDYQLLIQNIISKIDLIKTGNLVPAKHFSIDIVNRDDCQKDRSGFYEANSSAKLFDNRKVFGGVLDNYVKYAYGTKSLVFCSNIKHCINTTLEFIKLGFDARFAVSKISKPKKPTDELKIGMYNDHLETYELIQKYKHLSGDTEDLLDSFRKNEFKILVNVEIFTTGTDVPDIETIIVLRVINSKVLWNQIIGRGGRPATNKKHFNILDFAGNVKALGRFEFSNQYSLIHKTPNGGISKVKECEKCGCIILVQLKYCNFCGHQQFFEKQAKEIELKPVETIESNIDPSIIELLEKNKNKSHHYCMSKIIQTFGKEKFKEYCKSKGYSPQYYGFFLNNLHRKYEKMY